MSDVSQPSMSDSELVPPKSSPTYTTDPKAIKVIAKKMVGSAKDSDGKKEYIAAFKFNLSVIGANKFQPLMEGLAELCYPGTSDLIDAQQLNLKTQLQSMLHYHLERHPYLFDNIMAENSPSLLQLINEDESLKREYNRCKTSPRLASIPSVAAKEITPTTNMDLWNLVKGGVFQDIGDKELKLKLATFDRHSLSHKLLDDVVPILHQLNKPYAIFLSLVDKIQQLSPEYIALIFDALPIHLKSELLEDPELCLNVLDGYKNKMPDDIQGLFSETNVINHIKKSAEFGALILNQYVARKDLELEDVLQGLDQNTLCDVFDYFVDNDMDISVTDIGVSILKMQLQSDGNKAFFSNIICALAAFDLNVFKYVCDPYLPNQSPSKAHDNDEIIKAGHLFQQLYNGATFKLGTYEKKLSEVIPLADEETSKDSNLNSDSSELDPTEYMASFDLNKFKFFEIIELDHVSTITEKQVTLYCHHRFKQALSLSECKMTLIEIFRYFFAGSYTLKNPSPPEKAKFIAVCSALHKEMDAMGMNVEKNRLSTFLIELNISAPFTRSSIQNIVDIVQFLPKQDRYDFLLPFNDTDAGKKFLVRYKELSEPFEKYELWASDMSKGLDFERHFNVLTSGSHDGDTLTESIEWFNHDIPTRILLDKMPPDELVNLSDQLKDTHEKYMFYKKILNDLKERNAQEYPYIQAIVSQMTREAVSVEFFQYLVDSDDDVKDLKQIIKNVLPFLSGHHMDELIALVNKKKALNANANNILYSIMTNPGTHTPIDNISAVSFDEFLKHIYASSSYQLSLNVSFIYKIFNGLDKDVLKAFINQHYTDINFLNYLMVGFDCMPLDRLNELKVIIDSSNMSQVHTILDPVIRFKETDAPEPDNTIEDSFNEPPPFNDALQQTRLQIQEGIDQDIDFETLAKHLETILGEKDLSSEITPIPINHLPSE